MHVPGHWFAYAGPGWAAGPGRAGPGRARHRDSTRAVTKGTCQKAPGRCGKPGSGGNSDPSDNVPDLGINCETSGRDLHQPPEAGSPLPCPVPQFTTDAPPEPGGTGGSVPGSTRKQGGRV